MGSGKNFSWCNNILMSGVKRSKARHGHVRREFESAYLLWLRANVWWNFMVYTANLSANWHELWRLGR